MLNQEPAEGIDRDGFADVYVQEILDNKSQERSKLIKLSQSDISGGRKMIGSPIGLGLN